MQKYLILISLLLIGLGLIPSQLKGQGKHAPKLEQWLVENNIPVLGLGIIDNGKLCEIKVCGDLTAKQKAPYNTIFNVASLTKPVTAMITLKLVSQGEWNLDEPISKYWVDPDIQYDPRSELLTTRHLLSHQSGFTNWRDGKLEFQFDPGTQYGYSGEGFEYLRKALENKFKKSLNQLAKELIFEPQGMTDTSYIWDEKIDDSRLAMGYDVNGNNYEVQKRRNSNAADDLLTTIKDYGTFLVNVMKGEGLSPEVHDEMLSNQVATKNGKHFGLGFEKYIFKDGNYALSHGGSDQGVQTIVFIFPESKQGILIFTNVDDGYKAFEKLLVDYLGEYGREITKIETGKDSMYETVHQVNGLDEIRSYIPQDLALYEEIVAMDKTYFDAYNNCNMTTLDTLVSEEIEFFHDIGGLLTSKQELLKALENNICGKVRRELIEGSIEVYPIHNYGAIQMGYHKFYNKEEPDAESIPSKFISTWKNENGRWRITKVISLHN